MSSNIDFLMRPEVSRATPNKTNAERLRDLMTVFMEQLKNQDPTSPLEIGDFSQALGNIMMVEQSAQNAEDLKKTLEEQKKFAASSLKMAAGTMAGVVSYIGKDVRARGDEVRYDSEQGGVFSFSLDNNAADVHGVVFDDNDNVIFEGSLGARRAGDNVYVFKNLDAIQDKKYRLAMTAIDYDDNKVNYNFNISGVVKTVNFGRDGSVYLMMDDGRVVGLEQVSSVSG